MKNPWADLPDKPPYIAPVDLGHVTDRMDKLLHLNFDILPDPYIGTLEKAELVLLCLNPGFIQEDLTTNSTPRYVRQSMANLLHKSEPPFYMLDDQLHYSGGFRWWTRILKSLADAGVPYTQLSEKVMCIEYFPYHSVKYVHVPTLPSQEYSFWLVKEAIRQHKKIVVMRSEKIWLEAVPELIDYGYIKLKNFRNPTISGGNMAEEEFKNVLRALGQ